MAERTRRRSSGGSTRRRSGAGESSGSGGGRLVRDYSDEEYREPSEGYNGPEPTKGLYTAELVQVKDHFKGGNEDGDQSVRWIFRLAEGSENKHEENVTGWVDSQYTTENTAWREQQMAVAVGLIKPNGKLNMAYEQMVKKAKPCTCRVIVERYIPEDGGDAEWKGRMVAFMPLKEGTEKPSSSKASSRRRKIDDEEPEADEEDGDAESEEEDWPEDPDELAEALEDLPLAELKTVAKEDFEVKITRGMKADDIIDAILDTLPEDGDEEPEEEEPEDEPDPPKRRSRSSGASKGSPSRRRARGGSTDEPPF